MVYPGGKNGSGTYQKLINLMPPHRVYIEPFLGSGAIMRMKKPAPCSIGIDSDEIPLSIFPAHLIPGITIIHDDAISYLASNTFSDDTLIYLDPPYLIETRSSKTPMYKHELTYEKHRRLLEIIDLLNCMVMISGYYSDLYSSMLSSLKWRTTQFQAITRGGHMATEWVWMNYPEPFELHDYRYLGDNFRERERIKRKIKRWKYRLRAMPLKERYAMLLALQALSAETVKSDDGCPLNTELFPVF